MNGMKQRGGFKSSFLMVIRLKMISKKESGTIASQTQIIFIGSLSTVVGDCSKNCLKGGV